MYCLQHGPAVALLLCSPVIQPVVPVEPAYLKALMPADEDRLDPPVPSSTAASTTQVKEGEEEANNGGEDSIVDLLTPLNPFLQPPRKMSKARKKKKKSSCR